MTLLHSFNIPRKSRPPIIPDAQWFHPAIAQHLTAYSPKFHRLVNHLQAQHEHRHVIYTRFKEYFGLNLLQTILHYFGLDLIVVTGDDKVPEREAKYRQFNAQASPILLTTVVPSVQLLNVQHLHFIEGYDRDTLHAFLKYIYRKSSYPTESTLQVVSHVAQRASGANASDADYYEVIATYVERLNTTYAELLTTGLPIVFGEQGLEVIGPQ